MAFMSQATCDCFPTPCLRSCSLCLQEGAHLLSLTSQAMTGSFVTCLKVSPSSSSPGTEHSILSTVSCTGPVWMPPSAAGLQILPFLIDARPPGRLLLPFTCSIAHQIIPCVPSLWIPGRAFEHRSNLYSLFFQSSNPKKHQASNLHCNLCYLSYLPDWRLTQRAEGTATGIPLSCFRCFFT